VCLAVTDTGCGMEEATLKRIFEPFFTTKGVGQGTGLGLATAHGIVSQHKGWIEVASTLGRGTTFRVFLPAARCPAPGLPDAVEQPVARGGRETILVVEDAPSVRRILAQRLRLVGYRVWEAANGLEALQQWQEHEAQIDLLFTDMVMPEGLNGLELARRMRQGKPALKVIISTGYRLDTADQPTALEKVLFLSKPYSVGTMLEKVRASLDQK
jgi:CheY-like chemotaxis protein